MSFWTSRMKCYSTALKALGSFAKGASPSKFPSQKLLKNNTHLLPSCDFSSLLPTWSPVCHLCIAVTLHKKPPQILMA